MEYSIFSCEEELDEKEKLMTAQVERVHKLESLLDQINIHQQREAEIQASINEFEGKLTEIGDIDYDESAHTECKKKHEALIKDYERSLVLKEQLKRLPIVQKRISDAMAEIEAHKIQIDSLNNCLSQLSFSLKEHQKLIDKVDALEKQKHGLEVHIAAFKRDEEFAQTNFDRLNSAL